MTKTLTPQGISALLGKAGHARAKGRGNNRQAGFVVVGARDGAVSVTHDFASWFDTDAWHKEKLAVYAGAITAAGWSVETGTRELTVTAAEVPQPPQVKADDR